MIKNGVGTIVGRSQVPIFKLERQTKKDLSLHFHVYPQWDSKAWIKRINSTQETEESIWRRRCWNLRISLGEVLGSSKNFQMIAKSSSQRRTVGIFTIIIQWCGIFFAALLSEAKESWFGGLSKVEWMFLWTKLGVNYFHYLFRGPLGNSPLGFFQVAF